MMFEISDARKEVLEKLVENDWTPTDLADDLGKSPETIYNHLNAFADQGVLTKKQVAAKTRPKTEYSIGDGFVQYITVLPGDLEEKILDLDPHKEALFRIWNVPQSEFHPYLEEAWRRFRKNSAVTAVAVYGSVARGDADEDSDIDLLLLVDGSKQEIQDEFGTVRLEEDGQTKLAMTQVYTVADYKESLGQGSDFLENIQDELHIIHDPERIL